MNTPLSVIQLEAKGLQDGLQTPESASDHIILEVGRLRGLVTDLNWLGETDHGELRLTLESGPVHDLLAAEAERWRPQSQAQQVELSLRVSGDLPDMDVDWMRMSQALGKHTQERDSTHPGRRTHCAPGGRWRATMPWSYRSKTTGPASTPQTFPTSSNASIVPTNPAFMGWEARALGLAITKSHSRSPRRHRCRK